MSESNVRGGLNVRSKPKNATQSTAFWESQPLFTIFFQLKYIFFTLEEKSEHRERINIVGNYKQWCVCKEHK